MIMCVKIEIFINFSQKYRWSNIVISQQNICTWQYKDCAIYNFYSF
jgi:hypothetical protein